MNLIDYVVLTFFVMFVLSGCYRGFVSTLLSIGAYTLSGALALLLRPLLSGWVKGNASLYNMALYYAEGAELINDVELARTSVSNISTETLNVVLDNANLPIPMGKCIAQNIAKESFALEGLTTLGDYFNQTIVNVFINLLCVLLLFVFFRVLFAFAIRLIDYSRKGFPVLKSADSLIGGAFGLINGFLAMYIFFLPIPAVLLVLPSIGEVYLEPSFFGNFFYSSNFLLRLITGT